MKTPAIIVATALLSQAAFADDQDRTGWPESFTVATASQGGTYFAYGSGWANLVAEELGISGGGEVTGGPGQNMALVHTGDAQFGMTTMGPAAEAIAGESPIAPGLQNDEFLCDVPYVSDAFLGHDADVFRDHVDLRNPGRCAHRFRACGFHVRHLFPTHDGYAGRQL